MAECRRLSVALDMNQVPFGREEVTELAFAGATADPAKRPKQGEYRVVFAVISDRPGPLVLPFFSRLNLKHAVRRLDGYGFRVAKGQNPRY